MAAGSISASEFTNQANIFFTLSVKNNDAWELKLSPYNETELYLCKRCYVDVAMETKESSNKQTSSSDMTEDLDAECIEDTDSACVTSGLPKTSPCLFEYHIVYSPSYGVPVLYFNAYTPGGSLLSLATIWNNVPQHYQERLQLDRWTVLTQQEHPILARPFFQLHPCHTADLMKQLNTDTSMKNYLISWLSAVGPVVGLTLPLSFAQT